jgi:hypothetical protein
LFFTIESLFVVDEQGIAKRFGPGQRQAIPSSCADYRHHRAERLLDAAQPTARPVCFEGDTEAKTQQRNNQ